MFKNLHEMISKLQDEKACREYLIKERWNGVISCPYCNCEKVYVVENGKRFKCSNKACLLKFSVTVGTIFENSKIPLNKWFHAVYVSTAHKKGISSYQLARDLGLSQKTTWFMLHRIREVLRMKSPVMLGAKNIVEADETWVGGSLSNKSNKVRKEAGKKRGRSPLKDKTGVVAIVERGSTMIMKVIEKQPHEVETFVREHLDFASRIVTDTASYYHNINNEHYHYTVNHSIKEFARGDFHTNTVEGAFGLFKRMIIGIYHQIPPKHLSRYCDEFTYRYNTRTIKDADRFTLALGKIEGRLTYNKLVKNGKEDKGKAKAQSK